MLTKLTTPIWLSCFGWLLFIQPLMAETDLESEEEMVSKHIEVGSKTLDSQETEWIHERRSKDYEQENTSPLYSERPIQTTRLLSSQTQNTYKLDPIGKEKPSFQPVKAFASSSVPVPSHSIYSIADNDRSLELEDGSHWEVSDPYAIRTWLPGDLLTITPDYSWFSSYDYYITNKTANVYVKANLSVGPFSFGPYSNWIVDIDHFGGHIYLQNGTIWCVNPKDQYLLKYWAINDHIILGQENSFWSSYDQILINVNMDEFVRVRQY